MSDVDELHERMESALARISAGLERLETAGDGDPQALSAALEAERGLTRELQERLRGEDETHAARVAGLEREAAEMRAQIAALEEDRARLRDAADTLRNTCESLRRAAAEAAGDPDLVNGAMASEIDALSAVRASDRAELEAIIALLSQEGGEGASHG